VEKKRFNVFSIVLSIGLLLGSVGSLSAMAETRYRREFDARTQQYYYVPEKSAVKKTRGVLRNPVVKDTAIGAAVGAATGAISGNSVIKGAGVGAAVGVGTGLLDSSRVLEGRPMVRNAIKGAAIGTGASAVLDKSVVKGAAAGAAAGVGFQLLKDFVNKGNNTPQRY
jgi:outer membrane lipoprotein SlyB